MSEIGFEKYKNRGAYHWKNISWNLIKRNAFVVARYKNILSLVKMHFNDNIKGKKILDVGCGDGVLAYLLYKQGAKVSGIDCSDIAIHYAREKTKGLDIDFCQGTAYELPWGDENFDAVVSSDVIEHAQEVDKFLMEIRRVVKKGGNVVISTPIRYTEEPLDERHVTEWFPIEYKRVIKKYFPDSTFYETHPLFWMELLARSTKLRVLEPIPKPQ